jgi:hypothetical protein
METMIDLPEILYKKAKIRAIETGQTLKQIVLTSLTKELGLATSSPAAGQSFMERRKLLPEFAKFEAEGAFTPRPTDRDITDLNSDDRNAR